MVDSCGANTICEETVAVTGALRADLFFHLCQSVVGMSLTKPVPASILRVAFGSSVIALYLATIISGRMFLARSTVSCSDSTALSPFLVYPFHPSVSFFRLVCVLFLLPCSSLFSVFCVLCFVVFCHVVGPMSVCVFCFHCSFQFPWYCLWLFTLICLLLSVGGS